MRTGPAPRPSSPTSSRRSAWRSSPATRPRPQPPSLGEKRIAAFCASQGYSGKRPAAVLLARLRSAPAGTTGPALTVTLRDAVLALVAVLTALNTASQGPRPFRRHPARGASGRRDLHVAAKVGSGQRRPDARRVGRLPPSLRRTRLRRRPGRVHPRHQAIRQAPRRDLPLGLQQAVPPGDDHLRRQQPARQPLGRENLRTTPAPQAKTTPTPSASSPAPGSA